MDLQALDKAIQEIAKRRNELKKLDYNNPKYDELEEELHDHLLPLRPGELISRACRGCPADGAR